MLFPKNLGSTQEWLSIETGLLQRLVSSGNCLWITFVAHGAKNFYILYVIYINVVWISAFAGCQEILQTQTNLTFEVSFVTKLYFYPEGRRHSKWQVTLIPHSQGKLFVILNNQMNIYKWFFLMEDGKHHFPQDMKSFQDCWNLTSCNTWSTWNSSSEKSNNILPWGVRASIF